MDRPLDRRMLELLRLGLTVEEACAQLALERRIPNSYGWHPTPRDIARLEFVASLFLAGRFTDGVGSDAEMTLPEEPET